MNKIDKAKEIYQLIEPPAKLNYVVNSAIEEALKSKNFNEERKSFTTFAWFKPLVLSAASICIAFIVALNSSPVFAKSVYKIPILGSAARVFTFQEYRHSDEGHDVDIKVPAIKDTSHKDLERRINREIQSKVNEIKRKAELRAEQNRRDILAQGGKEEDTRYFTVHVDYEIKSSKNNILSFVVNDTESFANTYTYQTFYNINLKTGKEITLIDMLGKHYKEIVAESIKRQMKERTEKNHGMPIYFITDADFKDILNNLKFYIKPKGHVVISFDKGEISYPPLGKQEFEIGSNTTAIH